MPLVGPKSLFLVGCSAEKRSGRHPAGDLYSSDRFRLARSLMEAEGARWQILSGKHGLVAPTKPVAAYDMNLSEQPATYRVEWAQQIADRIHKTVKPGTDLVVIAEEAYYAGWLPILQAEGYRVHLISKLRAGSSALEWLADAHPSSQRRKMYEAVYDRLTPLIRDAAHCRTFGDCGGGPSWPSAGVYLFFEPAEGRFFKPACPKIIRVGTHGVSEGSISTLWQRLKAHKGDLSGLGNHRTSIFRLHVGTALMKKFQLPCPTWGSTTRPTPAELSAEMELERKVSEFIARMQVCVLPITDSASKRSDRAYVEQNLIAIASGRVPLECASEDWLGFHCANPAVRTSSLWNVNHTEEKYDPDFLTTLEHYVAVALGKTPGPAGSIAPANWYESSQHGFDQSFLF